MTDPSEQAMASYIAELLCEPGDQGSSVKLEVGALALVDDCPLARKSTDFTAARKTPAAMIRPINVGAVAEGYYPPVQVSTDVKVRLQALLSPELKIAPEPLEAHPATVARAQPVTRKVAGVKNIPPPATSEIIEEMVSPAEYLDAAVPWCADGRPSWAQQPFDVLLFRVSGLTLAVPLVTLGQIYPLTEELTPIFGQAEWFMGLLPTSSRRIKVVNTAMYVMPERYQDAFVDNFKYAVTIDGSAWGLAVDLVQQPTRLAPEEVTWRTKRSQRPWLAGTVKSAMCALLDTPQLANILNRIDNRDANPG